MATICYANAPELWVEFKEKLNELTDKSLDKESYMKVKQQAWEIYDQVMHDCVSKYSEYFKGINQSSEMTITSLKTLKSTMKAEANRLRLQIDENNSGPEKSSYPTDLVAPIDVETLEGAEAALRNRLKADVESNNLVNFDDGNIGDSMILAKLKQSIKDFVTDKGQSSNSEIDLRDNSKIFDSLKTFFEDRINSLSNDQKDSIFELTQMTKAEVSSSVIGSILSLMHQRKVKTFESLYACYLKDSLVCIQKKFPQLNFKQCMEVKEKTKTFYSRQILIGYFEMLRKSVENFQRLTNNSELVSVDELNIFCDELSKINDFNSRMKDPVIMNFEFRSKKYRLKPEQVKDVELLTTEDPITKLFPSVVIQRMMAAGKTLVLGTISVVKKALNKTQLSILVPPSSLYQSNTTAMQNRTYQYFKKRGINFTFPRFLVPTQNYYDENRPILEDSLKNVIELLTTAMNDNNYMILSPDTLHSFLNSYIEVLLSAESSWSDTYREILKQYAQIYRIFKQRGSIILDEIDMTMDPKKELNFPTQETEPYNMIAVSMLTDIMEFLVFDEEIINSGLNIHSNNQASLTDTNRKHCVELVLQYIQNQLENSSSLWYYLIFASNSHDINASNIMEFLRDPNMASGRDCITRFYQSGNEIIANALIIVKQQLHHQMEHIFKGTVNHNFGSAGCLRPEIKFAVPYAAANTPSTASVFADRWETLLKTLLMISASPCNLGIAKEFIDYAKIAISSESAVSDSIKTTVTFKNLKLILPGELCPLSLDSTNILHVETVQKALATRSPAAVRLLFTFYITQVFDKMTFPVEQITSNALNVASMFGSVQGYSGTIDNVNILPQHVVKDAFEDNMKNEKYNGGISLKLVKDCDDRKVEELDEFSFMKSTEDMVLDLMSLYSSNDVSENVSAIIDTGAFFKNFKNRRVAEAILAVCIRIEAVLYYDEDSNQLEFLRRSNDSHVRGYLETTDPDDITRATEVGIDKRFTFYDQRHITGSDILQPKTAHAIMTVGPRVLLRDILQGALRMRQFMTSQKVDLVTTKASRMFYCSKIKNDKEEMKVSDILILGALNEDEKQEHENVKLAFIKINAEIRAFVLDEISRNLLSESLSTLRFITKMVDSAKPLFLRSIKEVPLDWLQESKDEETSKILNAFTISRLHPLEKTLKDFEYDTSYNDLRQRFNSMKRKVKGMISPENKKYYYGKDTIRTPINLDDGAEVQQQTLTLTMMDLNMDHLLEKVYSRSAYNHSYMLLDNMSAIEGKMTLESGSIFVNLQDLYHRKFMNQFLKPYLYNLLLTSGDRIGVTEDLIRIAQISYYENPNDYQIFSNFTFEGTHILVQLHGDNLKVLLISSKHASSVLKTINNSNTSKYWICDLSGTVTATNDAETKKGENVLDFIPQIDYLIFDLLIFNGSLPQILGNSRLKEIYYSWLKSENFEKRAIFLRLRMKALMDRENEVFEIDDRDLGILKKFSQGIENAADSLVDGYPKGAIDVEYESSKIELLHITSVNHQTLTVTQNEEIDFDLDADIRQLLNIPKETEVNRTPKAAPVFLEAEDLTVYDVNLEEIEIPIRAQSKRAIINIANYPMAERVEICKTEVKQEKVVEVLATDINVDEFMSDYLEPVLTEFSPVKMAEVIVTLEDFNLTESDAIKMEEIDVNLEEKSGEKEDKTALIETDKTEDARHKTEGLTEHNAFGSEECRMDMDEFDRVNPDYDPNIC